MHLYELTLIEIQYGIFVLFIYFLFNFKPLHEKYAYMYFRLVHSRNDVMLITFNI